MQTTNDHPVDNHTTDKSTDQMTDRRVTVAEAAVLLGLSEDAVRSRLKRGTLRKEKAGDGTVFVVLGSGGSSGRPTNGTDRPTTGQSTDKVDQNDLIEVLREQVSFLRQQLEQEREATREEREANRENRRIIAGLVQRVPELEAGLEPLGADLRASEGVVKGDVPPEPQEAPPTRSWLYRFFFGT